MSDPEASANMGEVTISANYEPSSVEDVLRDQRLERHMRLSRWLIPRIENVGYFGLHSLPAVETWIPDDQIRSTFLNPEKRYSEAINLGREHETNPSGYTRRYERRVNLKDRATTEATTCYTDGHIVSEGYFDPDLSGERWLNPTWFTYKIHRHLQLTKEVFESSIQTCTLLLLFEQLESTTVAVFQSHRIDRELSYAGYHTPIIQMIQLKEIHGRERWNIKMDVVEHVMTQVARIYGLDRLPQVYWDNEGHLDYAKGFGSR